MVELGQAVNSVAVQLDADDESDCLPIVGVAHDQIGHYAQSASLIVVTITTRPTVHRKPPSGGSQPVAYLLHSVEQN